MSIESYLTKLRIYDYIFELIKTVLEQPNTKLNKYSEYQCVVKNLIYTEEEAWNCSDIVIEFSQIGAYDKETSLGFADILKIEMNFWIEKYNVLVQHNFEMLI